MRLSLTLPTDASIALLRFANAEELQLEDAAAMVLREWLIGAGYLELPHELDEDTATEGNA